MRRFAGLAWVILLVVACGGGAAWAAEKQTDAQKLMDRANKVLEQDPAGALVIMKQAADGGDPDAVNGLGTYRAMGVGEPADPAEALKLYERAAAGGSEAAALNLGLWLLGDEDGANDGRAIDLLKSVLDNDRLAPRTVYPLGRAMLFGLGGRPQNLTTGMNMLGMAEEYEPENPDLMFLLARGHQQGWGDLDPDPVKATRYFRRSAELGDRRAQWYYGMALLDGVGVRMDVREAWTWVRKSGEAGYVEGQISTAVMLAVGQGVQENDVEARVWYRKAAEQGSAHALRGLGSMLMTGEGGPLDLVTGQAYAEMAREGGDRNAGPMLNQLGKELSVEDRRRAEEIKIAWKRKYGDPR